MAAAITRFKIDGLHGLGQTIDVPIQENRLILVGENGTGKSTVLNLLYYLLTQQWRRLGEYRFDTVEVSASGQTSRLTHDDVETLAAFQAGPFNHELLHRYPPATRRELARLLSQESLFFEMHPDLAVDRFAEMSTMPRSVAKRLLTATLESGPVKPRKPLLEAVNRLESWDFGQFLYLPTYRRIEQDLKSIFRGIEIEEKVREFRSRLRKRDRSSFIELVEFGMEDVERTIQMRMLQAKENVRTGLSALTGTYLRDVIRGVQDNPDVSILRSMSPNAFEAMFARIDEAILPAADKRLLQTKITEMSKGHAIGSEDRVIAHFLSKLVFLYKQQQQNESDVRDFVDLCNAYLTAKQLVYDETNYEIYIRQTQSDVSDGPQKLALRVLSSGEKQIVSLFSHMYLSGHSKFFVLIDEPELSLSVPWQQRFLPDIMNTDRCTGLVAVTHSPFIWENEFEPYVKPLADFITCANVVH